MPTRAAAKTDAKMIELTTIEFISVPFQLQSWRGKQGEASQMSKADIAALTGGLYRGHFALPARGGEKSVEGILMPTLDPVKSLFEQVQTQELNLLNIQTNGHVANCLCMKSEFTPHVFVCQSCCSKLYLHRLRRP
jgi:hypothetical protein